MAVITGIVVAIITTIGTVINTIVTKHYSRKDDIEDVKKLIKDLKTDSDKRDDELNQKFKSIAMLYAKVYLIDFLSRVEAGEKMNKEQIRLLYEMKEAYNNAGGDSYVDDLFDYLKNSKMI